MSTINVTKHSKKSNSIVKGICHQGDLSVFLGESAGKQCVANCVMATIYATIVSVVQWNTKDVDGILHAGSTLYSKIAKTYVYLLVTAIENTVTEYGQRCNIEICKGMSGILTEKVDTVIGMKLSHAIKFVTKENELTYGVLCIGHLATASAWALII